MGKIDPMADKSWGRLIGAWQELQNSEFFTTHRHSKEHKFVFFIESAYLSKSQRSIIVEMSLMN